MATMRASKTNRDEDEYEIQDATDTLDESLGKKLADYVKHLSLKKSIERLSSSGEILPKGRYLISENGRKYKAWSKFMVIVSLYSSMFTPVEFGFYRGLPRILWIIDLVVQFIFFADVLVEFCKAYRDPETLRLVMDHYCIAKRYTRSNFFPDIFACFPWDTIYKVCRRREEVRFLVWIRLYRVRKVDAFFERLEKDIRINYFATRIVKLLAVELYCTHTAACIYYYLATTVRAVDESYTWIGSLTEGSFSYHDFRSINIEKRYITSLYWAILTMATVGYGDVHAVNIREMIFAMIYVSFDMILGAYLIGNMTALIVKGSNTERFRDKMTCLIKYMNKTRLPRGLRNQMKSHIRLQFENDIMDEGDEVLEDFPASIRSKIAHSLYSHIVEQVSMFKGCSSEFLDEIVTRATEENVLPGEEVIHQGGASDQFYIVCHGALEEIFVNADGKEEVIRHLQVESVFGEVGVMCDILQPYTVRVVELCKLIRLDKHSFRDIVRIYSHDGQLVVNNLWECRGKDAREGQLAADIAFSITKHAAELALMVNNASYQGDLEQLKHLVKENAVVASADYDGRTPLHLAASKGFEPVVNFLIREGADINAIDKFCITPLLEAVKGGHDDCLFALVDKGAKLHLQEPGAFLCQAVKSGNYELLRRLLVAGVHVSAADYDNRTALHLAAAEGSYVLTKLLIDAGADLFAKDRWGHTPLDEAMIHKHAPIIALMKDVACKGEAMHSKAFCELHPTVRARKLAFPLKVAEQLHANKLDGEEKLNEMGQGRIEFPTPSPQSSDSYPGTPTRGHSSRMDNESNSGRRLSGLGLVSPNGDLDASARYRLLPVRQVGRPATADQQCLLPARSHRRVTIFPYHPWTPTKSRTPGKVEWVPPTVDEILNLANQHFKKVGTKVLNQDAGEISSTDFIMDSDKVFVVDEIDILGGGS